MDKALYTVMTGASATLRAQGTVAHNLANASTVGFKAGFVATDTFKVPGTGLPTRIDAVPRADGFDAAPGSILNTGGALDVALHDGVWMAVQAPDGSEAYTRAGELRISAEGMLTTASGALVLGDGGPISLPPYEQVQIGGDGTLSIQPLGQGPQTLAIVGRLKLVQVESPAQLSRGEDGLMRANAELPPATGTALTAGALENSNVDRAGGLVRRMGLWRNFERQVKVMKDVEDNARSANSLLRLA